MPNAINGNKIPNHIINSCCNGILRQQLWQLCEHIWWRGWYKIFDHPEFAVFIFDLHSFPELILVPYSSTFFKCTFGDLFQGSLNTNLALVLACIRHFKILTRKWQVTEIDKSCRKQFQINSITRMIFRVRYWVNL